MVRNDELIARARRDDQRRPHAVRTRARGPRRVQLVDGRIATIAEQELSVPLVVLNEVMAMNATRVAVVPRRRVDPTRGRMSGQVSDQVNDRAHDPALVANARRHERTRASIVARLGPIRAGECVARVPIRAVLVWRIVIAPNVRRVAPSLRARLETRVPERVALRAS